MSCSPHAWFPDKIMVLSACLRPGNTLTCVFPGQFFAWVRDVVYVFNMMYPKTSIAVSLYSSRPDVRNVKDLFEW